jgi:hypothetical protein
MSGDNPVGGGVVVVGVDGSEASRDALRWAVRYARLAGTTVQVVTAGYLPASYGWAPTAARTLMQETERRRFWLWSIPMPVPLLCYDFGTTMGPRRFTRRGRYRR